MDGGRKRGAGSGTVRAQVRRYADVGITQWMIVMGAPFDLDALRLFAEEVAPVFR